MLVFRKILRKWLEMLVFQKILRTYLMDDPYSMQLIEKVDFKTDVFF